MSFKNYKLGRIQAPIPPNVPTLNGHKLATQLAPPKLIRNHVDFRPQPFGNESVGDCTAAAIGNAILAQAALGGYQVSMPDGDAVKFYSASTGYVPGDEATDQGATEVAVLAYQSRHGFQGGSQTPYVGLWANIPAGDLNQLRLAMTHLGVGYLGVSLALADQTTDTWDTDTPASQGDPTPGSWGGHALCIWSYSGIGDTDIVELATWGMLQKATWRWVKSRMDEAHCLAHQQLLPSGKDWAGIDRVKLVADVAAYAVGA